MNLENVQKANILMKRTVINKQKKRKEKDSHDRNKINIEGPFGLLLPLKDTTSLYLQRAFIYFQPLHRVKREVTS